MSKIQLYDFQRADVDEFISGGHKSGLFAYDMALGKDQPLDSKVLTPEGFARMGDMYVGREVISPDGTVTRVTGVFPQGKREVFKVTLKSGREVLAGREHLWSVTNGNDRARGTYRVVTTEDLLGDLKNSFEGYKWSIMGIDPVDLGTWDSALDPYLLGVILGDGAISQGSVVVSLPDEEIRVTVESLCPKGVSLKYRDRYDYALTLDNPGGKTNPITKELRDLGLMGLKSGDKFVPENLKKSSVRDRLSLLQGLLDTDGYTNGSGVEFVSKSKTLAEDVAWLIHSLGGVARVSEKTLNTGDYAGNTYYRVYGGLNHGMNPFRLSRKAEKYTPGRGHWSHDSIVSVEYVGKMETQCIRVEHDLREYVTDNFVRTHNTLTATTLAVELGTKINLIVAPQVTFDGWDKAIKTQTEGKHHLKWMKSTKQGLANFQDYFDGKEGWYFITWQMMRRGGLFETKTDMLIADEVHEIQNHRGSAQNLMLKEIQSEYKIGLSGTASGNNQQGIFGILNWLWPKIYKSLHNWKVDNFYCTGFGASLTIIREKKPGMATEKAPFFKRRLKEDHYENLIPKPYEKVVVEVDLSQKQREVYDRFEATSGSWFGDGEDQEFLYTSTSLVKVARLREIALGDPIAVEDESGNWTTSFKDDCESSKLDALERILQQHPEETFMVYTHSKKFIPAVVARLERIGIKAQPFTGDMNYKKKRKAIDEFGDKFQVLVATQASIGTGTDGLQYKSRNIVWLSRDVKVSVNTQAKDRLYRPGQKDRIRQWEIVGRNTADERTNEQIDLNEQLTNDMLNARKETN